jgi:hypothetical protein
MTFHPQSLYLWGYLKAKFMPSCGHVINRNGVIAIDMRSILTVLVTVRGSTDVAARRVFRRENTSNICYDTYI